MTKLSGTDGSSYYRITLANGTRVECNDVIDALAMSFNQGEAFKALWRMGRKPGTPAVYDAEKVVYFGQRELDRARRDEPILPGVDCPHEASSFRDGRWVCSDCGLPRRSPRTLP